MPDLRETLTQSGTLYGFIKTIVYAHDYNDLQGNLSENGTLQGTIGNSDNLTGSFEEHEHLEGQLGIGGGGVTKDYNDLIHKPQINEVELVGNRSLPELDIQPTNTYANNIDINNLFN